MQSDRRWRKPTRLNLLVVCANAWLAAFWPAVLLAEKPPAAPHERGGSQVVRCAVIGGLDRTGVWSAAAKRFEDKTGHRVETVSTGPKYVIAKSFAQGEIDLITMHSSDTIINLVADGLAENPQPWIRNDLVLVGPPGDPAGVRGEKDAVRALGKIIESKSKLLLHASLGTNEVLHDLLESGELELDPEHVLSIPIDKHREMCQRAAKEKAYTLVGRIPFLTGKIDGGKLAVMVQGDPLLRRPYLVATTTNRGELKRHAAAVLLAEFLRSPKTQEWIAEYGRGQLDKEPLFFRVTVPARACGRARP